MVANNSHAESIGTDSIGAAERYGENEAVYDIKDLHIFIKRNKRIKKEKSPKTTYPSK